MPSRRALAVTAAMIAGLLAPLGAMPGRSAASSLPRSAHVSAWQTRLLARGPTDFGDVSCPSTSVCTAVGGGKSGEATIFRTSNGGASWLREPAPPFTPLLSLVSCPTTSFCVAVGRGPYEPTLVETTNAGRSWSTLSASIPEIDYNIDNLDCVTRTTCYATVYDDLLVSRDGGATWDARTLNTPSYPAAISCPNVSTCFVTGAASGTFFVVRAADFGTSMTTVKSVAGAAVTYHDSAISCPVTGSCTAVVTSLRGVEVYSTSSGGRSWTHRSLPAWIQTAFGVGCRDSMSCVVGVSSPCTPRS